MVFIETGRPVSPDHTAHRLQPVGPEPDNGATQLHFTPANNGTPLSLLMWITEGGVGSIGEIGSIGQGLDCDNLLQQQLLASPLATANADNANAVIAGIQSQRPVVCPPRHLEPLGGRDSGVLWV